MLEWYFIVAIAFGGIVFIVVVGCIIRLCLKLNKHVYSRIGDDERGVEEKEVVKLEIGGDRKTASAYPQPVREDSGKRFRIESSSNKVVTIEEIDNALSSARAVKEPSAERSTSDYEVAESRRRYSRRSGSVTSSVSSQGSNWAYEGAGSSASGSMVSLASKASWMHTSNVGGASNLNLSVQCSLIYSRDLRHIAGKIVQVQGLTFNGNGKKPSHVRVHVVVLPIKKYALKTSWYQINTDGRVRIGEYFKFAFKLPPSELKTMLRVRLYGRKAKVGALGRPACMGECYVTLLEIINSQGGLTLWRNLSRGIPESILESQVAD